MKIASERWKSSCPYCGTIIHIAQIIMVYVELTVTSFFHLQTSCKKIPASMDCYCIWPHSSIGCKVLNSIVIIVSQDCSSLRFLALRTARFLTKNWSLIKFLGKYTDVFFSKKEMILKMLYCIESWLYVKPSKFWLPLSLGVITKCIH